MRRGGAARRVWALFLHDVRLQWRAGFYAAYAVVALFYALALGALPGEARHVAAPFVIFTDPAVLGFFFLGGLMLLERGEGAGEALAVAPARAGEYVAAKAGSLTALSTLVSVALVLALETPPVDWPLLLAAIALTSVAFIGLGVLFALRCATVSDYLVGSAVLLTPVLAPAFLVYLDPPAPAYLYPPMGALGLMRDALGDAALGASARAAAFLGLVLAAAGAMVWAARDLEARR